jgi:hypothetical protein
MQYENCCHNRMWFSLLKMLFLLHFYTTKLSCISLSFYPFLICLAAYHLVELHLHKLKKSESEEVLSSYDVTFF